MKQKTSKKAKSHKKMQKTAENQVKTQKITKNMMIGDLIRDFPDAAEVLMQEGIHCIGCGIADFETIEQGLIGHGRTKKQIEAFLKKLNKTIPSLKGSKNTLFVTERALKKIKDLVKKEKKPILRISVLKKTEFSDRYEFELVKKTKKDDNNFVIEKTSFSIPKKDFKKLKGSSIDFISSAYGEGFRIRK